MAVKYHSCKLDDKKSSVALGVTVFQHWCPTYIPLVLNLLVFQDISLLGPRPVGLFKSSTTANERFSEIQASKDGPQILLDQKVAMWWNSSFLYLATIQAWLKNMELKQYDKFAQLEKILLQGSRFKELGFVK